MDSSHAVELDSSPPPIPSQSSAPRIPRSRSLFFSGREEEDQSSPAETLHLLTAEADEDGSASEPDWTSDGYADPSDAEPRTSTGSPAGDRPAQLLSRSQMRQTAETAVKMGAGMAHTVAAKSEAQQAVGLYLADDDDAKAIGHPLADIMHRRGDIVGGKLSPDANDFLRSLMGVAGYVTKQVQKVGVVRQLEAGAAAAEVQHLPQDVA